MLRRSASVLDTLAVKATADHVDKTTVALYRGLDIQISLRASQMISLMYSAKNDLKLPNAAIGLTLKLLKLRSDVTMSKADERQLQAHIDLQQSQAHI